MVKGIKKDVGLDDLLDEWFLNLIVNNIVHLFITSTPIFSFICRINFFHMRD